LFSIFSSQKTPAQKSIKIYLFYSDRCYHCKKEKIFLKKMEKKYPNIEIHYLESVKNKQNRELYDKLIKAINLNIVAFPVTVIGEKHFVGFSNDEGTGKNIEDAILDTNEKTPDIIDKIKTDNIQKKAYESSDRGEKTISESINVPIFGNIKIKSLSLPIITILLGAVDGFNPCAMWSLVMLISFLIPLQNRKRMILLGSIFIFISAFVYFLFMVAWLNFMIFLSYVNFVKIFVGIIALAGGVYYLKEYFFNKENICKVTNGGFKQKVSNLAKFLTENNKLFLSILGISLLAFLVNLVDFVCSSGIPVVYTQILSLSSLSYMQYYLYIFLYIFVFMLDDIIIFLIAIFSLHVIGLTTKYSRFSHLFGGAILIILGFFLIFKPNFLIF
jgi:thiol-disulfide isomerase/thioredoxin